ncbi:MAG: phosphoglycolate phosphatase-like HAD superfamily hydrolase [Limisphaerales bacterium]|jgi:phosphoglycolate phosphatase-like HAD superfamily hydrolase
MAFEDLLLVFDIDGTLTDSTEVDDLCFIQTFSDLYNIDLRNTDWSKFVHVTDWGMCYSILKLHTQRRPTKEEVDRIREYYCEMLKTQLIEKPTSITEVQGAIQFINFLQEKNCALAMATGAWGNSAKIKLGAGKIPVSEIPLSHSDLAWSRSSILEKAVQNACSKHNRLFSKVIYFGDGLWDQQTCTALSIPMVGIDVHQTKQLDPKKLLGIFSDFSKPEEILDVIFRAYE